MTHVVAKISARRVDLCLEETNGCEQLAVEGTLAPWASYIADGANSMRYVGVVIGHTAFRRTISWMGSHVKVTTRPILPAWATVFWRPPGLLAFGSYFSKATERG